MMDLAEQKFVEFALPVEAIIVRSRFKCGHTEDEVAHSPYEARHLRESAAFYPCVRCLVATMNSHGRGADAVAAQ